MRRSLFRNYAYRPPRQAQRRASRDLYRRFLIQYLLPHWRALAVAFLLIGANACSPYLMAHYGRIIIDRILVVEPDAVLPAAVSGDRPWADGRAASAATPAPLGLFRSLDASASSGPPADAERLLLGMFGLYFGSVLLLNFIERLAQRNSIVISRNVAAALREDMHQRVLDLSLRFHQATTPGRLLARITSDVDVIQDQTLQAVVLASRAVSMLVIGFLILFTIDWRIALAFLLVAPAYGLVHFRYQNSIKRFNRELRHTNSCLYGLVTQKMEGTKVIQAYVREGLERLHMHRLSATFLRDALGQQRQTAALQGFGTAISGLASTGIFIFAVTQVLDGNMSIGELLFVHGTVANLFMPIMQLTQFSITISNMQVTLGRMLDVLETEPEIRDSPDAVPLPAPLKKGIVIRDLAFSYGDPDSGEAALRSINLTIPPGSWLCLMGASGSGKSTLLFLLARLYQPTRGAILIDGIPIERLTLASVRQAIGFVPQTPQIFSGSLRDNLTYGRPDATNAEIMEAAQMAELHDFILRMPVQYETLIGERGTSLSGGQRQRLALARALLTQPEILLLDDCTSALDAHTEDKIQTTLATVLRGKTAVIASQRIGMARRCDRIAVLDNGMISEYGTHDELVRLGGFYAKLHEQQTEGRPCQSKIHHES